MRPIYLHSLAFYISLQRKQQVSAHKQKPVDTYIKWDLREMHSLGPSSDWI